MKEHLWKTRFENSLYYEAFSNCDINQTVSFKDAEIKTIPYVLNF